MRARQHHRLLVVRELALRLGVDSLEREVVPHLREQVVKVPFVVRRDRDCVRDFVDDIELQRKARGEDDGRGEDGERERERERESVREREIACGCEGEGTQLR